MPSDAETSRKDLIAMLRACGDGPFPPDRRRELILAYANVAGEAEIPSIASLAALLVAEAADRYLTPADIRHEWRHCHRITFDLPYKVLKETGSLNRPTEATVNAAIERLIEATNATFFRGCDANSVAENSELNDLIHHLTLVTCAEVENAWEFCLRNGIPPFPTDDSPYSLN